MTPITDIADSIKHGDTDSISDHSIRDRMRFVDACVTDLLEAIHPFIGPRRVEAFYESKVESNIPPASEAIHRMEIVLRSVIGTKKTQNISGRKMSRYHGKGKE